MNTLLVILVGVLLVNSIAVEGYTNTVGGPCTSHSSCVDVRNSECVQGMCQCMPNYEPVEIDSGDSVCKGSINATCEYDDDCLRPNQVSCIFNTCQDYIKFLATNPEKAKLYRATGVGSRCETEEHCSGIRNTTCVSGKCQCVEGFEENDSYRQNNICVSLAPYIRRQCSGYWHCGSKQMYCLIDTCLRPEEFFIESNAYNISIYTAKYINDPCQTDHHCRNIKNSHCNDGKCKCKEGFSRESNGERCWRINPWSKSMRYDLFYPSFERSLISCNSESDCGGKSNLHCYQNKCVCSNGYHLQDGECYKITNPNCSVNYECSHGTRCLLNNCRYANEFISNYDTTNYTASGFDSICLTDYNCRKLKNTVCHENRCVCNAGYKRTIFDTCNPHELIECARNTQCSPFGEQCILGFCREKWEFFFKPANIDHALYVATDHFDVCTTDYHCRNLNNTKCHNRACECLPGYEVVSGTCQKAIGINCTDNRDCLFPGSRCIFNTCIFIKDFLALPTSKITEYTTKTIDGFCQTTDNCRNINNSMCYYSKCTCEYNFSETPEWTNCIRKKFWWY